jgi:uncharacterized protein (TIGR02246 family)
VDDDLRVQLVRLTSRVADLEARAAIEDLHRSLVRAVADRRFTILADWFTDDAVIDMRSHGPKAGRSTIAEHFAHMDAVPLDGAGYILSSPVVTVTGDEAEGEWTWHRLHSTAIVAGRPVRVSGPWEEGRYSCTYRRVDGRWRFHRMRFRVVRPDLDPEHDAAPAAGSEAP